MKGKILILIFLIQIFSGCGKESVPGLYSGFVNPPAEARPFVRWWWNGNRITEKEIIRQPEYWLWSHKRWKHKPDESTQITAR